MVLTNLKTTCPRTATTKVPVTHHNLTLIPRNNAINDNISVRRLSPSKYFHEHDFPKKSINSKPRLATQETKQKLSIIMQGITSAKITLSKFRKLSKNTHIKKVAKRLIVAFSIITIWFWLFRDGLGTAFSFCTS